VPVSKVQFLEEIHNDPQVVANALLRERHHPVAGHLREARPAPVFKRAGLEPAGFAPTIGEHSEEILTELGLAASLPELTANHAIKVGG
jgi:formyl-CoA transferase